MVTNRPKSVLEGEYGAIFNIIIKYNISIFEYI